MAAARAVGYVGVGTVEFLVDDGRLLLPGDEHPAAGRARGHRAGHRARPGRAAAGAWPAGARCPSPRTTSRSRGHAVEVRLCAERPRDGYRPTPGRVPHARWPADAGLRADARSRDRQRGQPGLRLPGGQGHGARGGPAERPSRGSRGRCARSSSTGSRPTATCSPAVLDDEASAAARRPPTFSRAAPTCATPACPTTRGTGTPRRRRFACSQSAAGVSLVPVPEPAGATSAGRSRRPARRRGRHREVRAARSHGRPRSSSTATWRDVSRADAPRPRRAASGSGSIRRPRPGSVVATGCGSRPPARR